MDFQKYHPKYESEISQIFFETSSVQNFEGNEHRSKFFKKYLGIYIEEYPETFFIALEQDKVLGYLAICTDTIEFMKSHSNEVLELFTEYYPRYPAHLHINISPAAQGKSVGSKLMTYGLETLNAFQTKGIHLITAANARNIGFYLKNGFEKLQTHQWQAKELLLLGKELGYLSHQYH